MRRYELGISIAIFAMFLLAGCSDRPEEKVSQSSSERDGSPVVYVSNYPLLYFLERLAPWANRQFPAAISGDPSYWKPTVEDVTAMQQADLIILNGASYEKWLKNVSLPPSKLINTTAGLDDQLIALGDNITHSHGLEGEHEHSGTAFTTWLDIKLAAEQVRAIAVGLSARWPEHKTQLEQSRTALAKDLLALDEEVTKVVRVNQHRPVVFSHPVYQYLQQRYGLNGRSVHWEPDEIPGEMNWAELAGLLGDFPAKWMIWEGKPLPEIATRLESMGLQSVIFDPCASRPAQGDFLSTMRTNLEALRIVYQ